MWLAVCSTMRLPASSGGPCPLCSYRRLFADRHLVEFGRGLAAVKQAASGTSLRPGGDIQWATMRHLRTSVDLALLDAVTIDRGAGTSTRVRSAFRAGCPRMRSGRSFSALGQAARRRISALFAGSVAGHRHHAEFELNEAGAGRLRAASGGHSDRRWLQASGRMTDGKRESDLEQHRRRTITTAPAAVAGTTASGASVFGVVR